MSITFYVLQLFWCDICSPGSMPDSRLAAMQPLPLSLKHFKTDGDDKKPPAFPATPAASENAVQDRLQVRLVFFSKNFMFQKMYL